MRFFISKSDVEYAKATPFTGCFSPINAAYGRAAEQPMRSITAQRRGEIVLPPNSPNLPYEHREKLGKDRVHDHLAFTNQLKFVGVYEMKLDVSYRVSIGSELHVLDYCRRNNLEFILSIAKLLSKNSLECEYWGSLNLVNHPELLSGGYKVNVTNFRKVALT